jgi:hypothetical protein
MRKVVAGKIGGTEAGANEFFEQVITVFSE